MRRAAVAAVGVALATAAPLAGYRAGLYPDAPPPATTGGFGEPTCVSCHFAPAVPDTAGSLAVEGLPGRYQPGHRYELTVALDRPGMKRAGFQLSARVAEGPDCGMQAGRFEVFDPGVAVTTAASIQYVHQTADGAIPDAGGRARWTVRWTAPEKPRRVLFHVAANAANGDDSALGDVVFAIEREVPPASGRNADAGMVCGAPASGDGETDRTTDEGRVNAIGQVLTEGDLSLAVSVRSTLRVEGPTRASADAHPGSAQLAQSAG